MKIAVIYNRESQNVINLFGVPSREKYGKANIRRITDALKKGGHQVAAFEGDKDVIRRLEEYMPSVLKGERPGMVFNLSYGIQGQARYTHVPGMLEMLGIPYVGSGPLAHSLALDKVVAKMMFRQHGLPTPGFAVLDDLDGQEPDLPYPLIVKPKHESTSFGVAIVDDAAALRAAAKRIFDEFGQPVLVEQYIKGREINVGLLGNGEPDAFPPAELIFDGQGPPIYTMEDKKGESGRTIEVSCPADVPPIVAERAQQLARQAFGVLGCADCARVDFRMDRDGELYILELNSLPSLGQRGSYAAAASQVGLDFSGLVNRLVEVASARYFGTPSPVPLGKRGTGKDRKAQTFAFLTARRDVMERRLRTWMGISSRTDDPIGIRHAQHEFDTRMRELGLRRAQPAAGEHTVSIWETDAGYEGGTLLLGHVDVPLPQEATQHAFRREPEWLHGEGVGSSRVPLVTLEYALRAAKSQSLLGKLRLGVLQYGDEGLDCRFSAEAIRHACRRARNVLVLTPSGPGGKVITGHRGLRKYRLVVEGTVRRLGQYVKHPAALSWACAKLGELELLTDRKARVAVAARDLRTDAFPRSLPHRVTTIISVSYPTVDVAVEVEERIRAVLGKRELSWELEPLSDRPPMARRPPNVQLAKKLSDIAARWDIPLEADTSLQPSAAGYVPEGVAVVCGLGPAAYDLFTPQERVQRLSFVQRTLILAQFLVEHCR